MARSQPNNPLVQHRGQPSTHDVQLGSELFDALSARKSGLKIPSYDKSAFSGSGDRRPESEWATVNAHGEPTVEVVILEGWCVGFRALSEEELVSRWKAAEHEFETNPDAYNGQLGRVGLESVRFVNETLKEYDVLTE